MKDLAYFSAKNAQIKDNLFMQSRDFINQLDHIDQIWEYLNHKNGNVLAVKNFIESEFNLNFVSE